MYYGCKVGEDSSSVTDSCLSLGFTVSTSKLWTSASKSLQSALNNLPHCYAQATHKCYTNLTSRLLKLIFVVGEFEALRRVINKHRLRRVAKFNSSMWILIPITRAGVFLSHNDVCTVTIEVTFFGQIFLKLYSKLPFEWALLVS